MSATEQVWRVPLRLEDVPESGRQLHLIADEETRVAAARAAAVTAIPRIEAVFEVTRCGRDGLHVAGEVSATVRQNCVVTLEPVENAIKEAVDLTFTASGSGRGGEIAVGAPEPPEPLVNGVVDLGAIAVEFLILGIDPYPRKSGAVFEAPEAADAAESPFAVLAARNKAGPDR